MTAEEYVDFDVERCSSLPPVNYDMVDWRVSLVIACVTEYLRKECGDLNEVDSDNDDGASRKDVKVIEIGTNETLTMLDRLVNQKDLSTEERNFLVAMTDKLEDKSAEQKTKPCQ